MSEKVLLIEDDAAIRFGVTSYLERSGYVVAQADSCADARAQFRKFEPSAVVTDFRLPDGEALELIAEFRLDRPTLPIVVLTGYGSIELAVNALRTGAHNLMTKPVDMKELVAELRRACAAPAGVTSGPQPRAKAARRAPALFDFEENAERLKHVDCALLILGETGTGKTMLARQLHEAGRRRDKPFVDLNCAGLARDLVESELFGHERGAFTSAIGSKARDVRTSGRRNALPRRDRGHRHRRAGEVVEGD